MIRQQISNHPSLTNIERYVHLTGLNYLDSDEKIAYFRYRIEYLADGENDVSGLFTNQLPNWGITDPQEFDQLLALAFMPESTTGISEILSGLIIQEDAKGFFNY